MRRHLRELLAALLVPLASATAQPGRKPSTLPVPSGPYPVGTRVLHLVDSSRITSRRLRVRPLTVQLWYPATKSSAPLASYLTAPLIDSMKARHYFDVSATEIEGWSAIQLAAKASAPALAPPRPRGWPVITVSHGLGLSRAHYAPLSQDLGSHGFVVITLDHPIGGFGLAPDGSLLTPGVDSLDYRGPVMPAVVLDWAIDIQFVLRTLALRQRAGGMPIVDTSAVGALGHSLGGAAALQACRSVALIRSCIDMDGDPFGEVETLPVTKPFLVLLSQPDHTRRPPPRDSAESARRAAFARMGAERDSMWQAIARRNTRTPSAAVKLVGTGHFSFSDAPFTMPSQLAGVGATLSPLTAHARVADLIREFFNATLLDLPLTSISPGLTTRDPR